MIRVAIVKRFHRDIIALKRGETYAEGMTFVSWDDAVRWASGVTKNWRNVPYHVAEIVWGDRTFVPEVPAGAVQEMLGVAA